MTLPVADDLRVIEAEIAQLDREISSSYENVVEELTAARYRARLRTDWERLCARRDQLQREIAAGEEEAAAELEHGGIA